MPSQIAGEIKDFRLADYVESGLKPNRLARFTQIALAATRMAIKEANLSESDLRSAAPIPLAFGVSTNAMDVIEKQHGRMQRKGSSAVSALGVPTCLPQAAVNAIARMLTVDSRLLTLSTGCPAGLDAIAAGMGLLTSGEADIVIAGASDTPVTPLTVASFSAARALSTCNSDPAAASRPFDAQRDGGVIAEGTGVLVLEDLDHAMARGAEPLVELTGFGTRADAYGADPASGLRFSMQEALDNAACPASRVKYINAHGPSDRLVDRSETAAIKAVFGDNAYDLPVSSIKGVTGNPLSAAGPMQVIATLLAMRKSVIPPTANYEVSDPDCDLDYVPGEARSARIDCALVNTHGIGGTNTSILLERYTP
jgi:3-oxoacyl-[acyl-carrier-protein] synthase II